MTWLDPTTMSAVTALVVTICAVLFLIDTVTFQANAAARLWAAAFVWGVLTAFAYWMWTFLPDGEWIANAVGNAAFVASTGSLWLGCRRFNGSQGRGFWWVSAAAALTLAATLVPGPGGGPWAGAWAMFVSLATFTALGAVEARRGALARYAPALWFTIVLAAAAVYYVARTVVFAAAGSDSPIFIHWFGTPSTSMLTIALTVTAVVAMVVLRVQEQAAEGTYDRRHLSLSDDGYLDARSFELLLERVLEQAHRLEQPVTVIAIRMDGHEQIRAAYGNRQAREILERWRAATIRGIPLGAFFGHDDAQTIYVAIGKLSDEEATALAERLTHPVLEELDDSEIVPLLGVGVATDPGTRSARELIAAADRAAERSAQNLDTVPVLDSSDDT